MNRLHGLLQKLAAAVKVHPCLCFHSGWVPILLAVAAGAACPYLFSVNVPVMDDWECLPIFAQTADGALYLSSFWEQENEHRMLFPKLVFWAVGTLTKYDLVVAAYVNVALLAGVLAMLGFAFVRQCPSKFALWLLAPLAFLVFDWGQEYTLRWGLLVQNVLVLLASTAAFLLLQGLQPGRRLRFLTAVGAATVASFSSAHGLLVWPVGLAQVTILNLPRTRKWPLLACWAAFGAAVWAAYFYGYVSPWRHPKLAVNATYLLAMIGRPLTGKINMAIGLGAALPAMGAVAVAFVWRRRQWSRYSFWLALSGFSFLTMVTVMLGRSGLGVTQSAESRYVTMSFPFLGGLYALLVLQNIEKPHRLLLALAATVAMLMAVGLRASAHNGYRGGQKWRNDLNYQAYLLWTMDDQPEEVLRRAELHDRRQEVRILRSLGYSTFADREFAKKYYQPDVELPRLNSPCRLGLQRVELTRDRSGLMASGWAMDSRTGEPAAGVCLVVDDRVFPLYYGDLRRVGPAKSAMPCGFRGSIRLDRLPREPRRVELRVLTADRSAYWSMPLWPHGN